MEKEMATHSSTLAWRNPWLEEPGGPPVHGAAKSRTRLSDFTSSLPPEHKVQTEGGSVVFTDVF